MYVNLTVKYKCCVGACVSDTHSCCPSESHICYVDMTPVISNKHGCVQPTVCTIQVLGSGICTCLGCERMRTSVDAPQGVH